MWVCRYARLMAQHEPERLSAYALSTEANNLPLLLNICREFTLVEAEAVILERQGDISAAYDLLLGRLKDSIAPLFIDRTGWDNFHAASQSVFDFCQRQAGRMTEVDRERIWLSLLDQLLAPQQTVKGQPDADFILSGG